MEQVNKLTNINVNEFDKIESMTNTEIQQIKPQFDFYKDFEMRELLEKNSTESNLNYKDKNKDKDIDKDIDINMMLNSFPIINDNLRANILLSIEIYKKINNFEMTYVHEIINENTKKNI
jgi:hypothetical protein